VTIEVRRPLRVRLMVLSLHLLAASTLIAWVVALSSRGEWITLWWVLPGGLAWLLALGWLPLAGGQLRWEGERWLLTESTPHAAPQREGSLHLALDAGSWVLLQFRPRREPRRWSRSVWMVLARHASADEWSALRRTLYSPRPEPAAASAQAAANSPA
jgi:hypothetical protein